MSHIRRWACGSSGGFQELNFPLEKAVQKVELHICPVVDELAKEETRDIGGPRNEKPLTP